MSVLQGQQHRIGVIWSLAWPAIIEQILMTMVSYVDTAMVGSLGANGTAAVSVNAAPTWVVGGILMGVSVGYSVQVSNAVGAGDDERVKKIIRQSLLAVLVCGSIACVVLEALSGHIPRWMGAEPDVLPHAINYLRIYSAALPFFASMALFSAVLRCMGNTRTPMAFNIAANGLNMVLNFFLIYPTREWKGMTIPGAGLGVEGAAIATALSIVLGGTVACIAAFRQGKYATSPTEGIAPDRAIIAQTVRLGLPSAAERVTVSLGQVVTTVLLARVGTVALAANQIANTAEGLCYLPAFGIGSAAVALVGQSMGAGNKEDAKAYGTLTAIFGTLLCLGTAVALFLFAPWIAAPFNSDPAVVAEAALALRIVAFAEPLFALSIVTSNALRGAQDVRIPMLIGLGGMWLIRVPLSCVLVLGFGLGLEGVWGAMALDLGIRGILCGLRWKNGRWMETSN